MYHGLPFPFWRTLWSLLTIGNHEKGYYEHLFGGFCVDIKFSSPLGKHQGLLFPDFMNKSVLNFVRNCWTVLKSCYVILHFHQQCCNSSCFFTSFPAFSIASNLYFDHLNRCVTVFHDCFNLYFPDDIWCRTYFPLLMCHLYAFFGEISFQDFGLLFSKAVFFFFSVFNHWSFLLFLIHFG